MPRKLRKLSSTGFYHVIIRGNGKQLLFLDDGDRGKFLSVLADAFEDEDLNLIAWCLMDNHVHLCIEDREEESFDCLSAAMKFIGDSYARWFNDHTGHVGHVFQDRFESLPVESEAYLLGVVRYIHQNPVRARLCSACEYPWSSYHEYVGEAALCTTELVLEALGGVEGFEEFMAQVPKALPRELTGVPNTLRLPDAKALDVARGVLGDVDVGEVKSLPPRRRDAALLAIRDRGIPGAQIARLTGIGERSVARAIARARQAAPPLSDGV